MQSETEFNKRSFLLNVYRITIAAVLLYLLSFWIYSVVDFRKVLLSVCLVLIGIGYFLAHKRSIAFAAHYYAVVCYATISINSVYMGGVSAPGMIWFMMCPMVSFLTLSFTAARIWLIVVLATMLTLFLFEDWLIHPVFTGERHWYLLANVMFSTTFYFLLKAFRAKVVSRTVELLRVNKLLNEQQTLLEEARATEAERSKKLQHYLNQHLEISRMEEIHTGSFQFAVQAIQRFLIRSLNVDSTALWYLHPDAQELKLIGSLGREVRNKYEIATLKKDYFPDTFETLESGAIVTSSNDSAASYQLKNLMHHHSSDRSSLIACPFFIEGKIGGFFMCRSFQHVWAEEDIIFVRAISDTLSLAFKSHQRKMHQRELEQKQRQIEEANELLEKRIADRTTALNQLNAQLTSIAFTNAHVIRGPICRLVGLNNLLQVVADSEERQQILQFMELCIDELNAMTIRTSAELNGIIGK